MLWRSVWFLLLFSSRRRHTSCSRDWSSDVCSSDLVLEGRYGPSVTDGELNASIPKGIDPATLTLEHARTLLDARRDAAPSPRQRGRAPARGRKRAAHPVAEA